MSKEKLYYIRRSGFIGNSAIWWGKNHSGYTSHLNKAGKYTEKEAFEICARYKGDTIPKDRAYPCDYIDKCEKALSIQVDPNYLDESEVL